MKKVQFKLLKACTVLVALIFIIANIISPLDEAIIVLAKSYPLSVTSVPVAYTPTGGYTDIAIKVKNNDTKAITGISLIDYTIITESEDAKWTPYMFQYEAEKSGETSCKKPTNAKKDDLGYTIEAGKTATFYIRVFNNHPGRKAGTYTDFIKLGRKRRELKGEYDPEEGCTIIRYVTTIEEEYTDKVNITNTVYKPSGLLLSVGTSDNYGRDIKEFGSTIDFGKIDLSKADDNTIKQNLEFYVKNVTTAKEEHNNSRDITVDMGIKDYNEDKCFYFGSNLLNGMSWAPLPPATENSYNTASGSIAFNAREYIAGTYTTKLRISTISWDAKVNGKQTNTDGDHFINVKVVLTGTNPRLPKKATNFKATPSNNQVELTWTSPTKDASFAVYRREGTESKTNPDTWTDSDWNNYEILTGENVFAGSDGSYLYVDGTAKNGKTYTYVVIAGSPFKGYASTPVSAKPDKTKVSKIQKPERVYTTEKPGGVYIDWEMNGNYGGSNFSGDSLVDHFNIYCDGNLVKQVNQSAVSDIVYYGYIHNEDDSYTYGITSHDYSWNAFIPVAHASSKHNYTFQVSAVSKAGEEGYLSDPITGYAAPEGPVIVGHDVFYSSWEDWDTGITTRYISFNADINSYGYVDLLTIWRKEGTSKPDITLAPYATSTTKGYEDENITEGKTYTYTIQAMDYWGNLSEPYTFQMKAIPELESHYSICGTADVNFKSLTNKKVQLQFYSVTDGESKPIPATYKIYRNNTVIKTITMKASMDPLVTYTDDPGKDGTYTYRIDKIIQGMTIKGEEFVFVRNTGAVDTETFLKVPDAPTLNISLSDGIPVLEWSPASTGGKVEGYHIYRKDAGVFVVGQREVQDAPWLQIYSSPWGNNRYLTIQDPTTTVLVDTGVIENGEYGFYKGDRSLGTLENVSWYEDNCPHEYWITAYNETGESKPSKVIRFDYVGQNDEEGVIIPINNDQYAPGAPTIKNTWVEWEDCSQDMRYGWDNSIYGYIKVNWEDNEIGGQIDYWNVYVQSKYEGYDESKVTYASVMNNSGWRTGGEIQRLSSGSVHAEMQDKGGDYDRKIKIYVGANNSKGETKSKTVTVTPKSLPRFRIVPANNSVKLEWTDLYNDTKTTVKTWEIHRKEGNGAFKKIKSFTASTLKHSYTDSDGISSYIYYDNTAKNNTTYQYKVVAKCNDNIDRESNIREAIPRYNLAYELAEAPTNLTAKVINGEILLSWKAPSKGATPYRYIIEEYMTYGSENYWYRIDEVYAPSTTYVLENPKEKVGTYRFRVYATTMIGDYEHPYEDEPIAYSNEKAVTLKAADIKKLATERPGKFKLYASSPSSKEIALRWSISEGATYYEISRIEMGDVNITEGIFCTVTTTDTSFTDTTVEPGTRYEYYVQAFNSYGQTYESIIIHSAGQNPDSIAAEEVSALIMALPKVETITFDNVNTVETKVIAARSAYDALTTKQKELISTTNKTLLSTIEDRIALLKNNLQYKDSINAIQKKINALTDASKITKDNVETINTNVTSVRNDYDQLNESSKQFVDATKLTNAEAKIKEIKELIEKEDIEAANAVIAKIKALPSADSISINDEKNITETRNAYNALTKNQKAKITKATLKLLTQAETALKNIKDAINVSNLIANINNDEITTNSGEAIQKAREAYDALTADAKAKITTLEVKSLEVAEEKYNSLKEKENDKTVASTVVKDINTIKKQETKIAQIQKALEANKTGLSQATINNYLKEIQAIEKEIKKTSANYTDLTSEQKSYVTNADSLANLEKTIGKALATLNDYGKTSAEVKANESARKNNANAVIAKIKALPTAATISKTDEKNLAQTAKAIEAARKAYQSLSSEEKALVSNITTLLNAEKALGDKQISINDAKQSGTATKDANIKAAKSVIDTIKALPDINNLKGEDKTKIEEARKAYDKLTADQKALIEANIVKKLTDAEEKAKTLKLDISKAKITGNNTVTYNGKAQTPKLTIKYGTTTLVKDTDYTVTYSDNINAGQAKITIKGKGNYEGTAKTSFTIDKASVEAATITGIVNKEYTGKALTQNITVKIGTTTLTNNTDYTISYKNNTNVGTATLTISGKGNYKETKSESFTITKAQTSYEDKDPVVAFVKRLYILCLNRPADQKGLNSWVNLLKTKQKTAAEVVDGFFSSKEMNNLKLSDEVFVERCYLVMMDRASDAGGRTSWLKQLKSGVSRKTVLKGFIDSKEFTAICNKYKITKGTLNANSYRDKNQGVASFVARCYTKALGRNYDEQGLENWCKKILTAPNKKQEAINTASNGFFHSQEFINKRLSNIEYVKVLYRTFLGREYDQKGLDSWLKQMEKGMTRDQVLQGFAGSQEFSKIMASYGIY